MKYELTLREDNRKIVEVKSNSMKEILREVERKFDKDLLGKKK